MMSDQKKTKNERRYYTEFLNVKALSSMHPEIKKLKTKNSSHAAHGNKNWRSSFVLMDYLKNDPPKSREKILDIGCGWGLVSIFLSKNFNNEVHSSTLIHQLFLSSLSKRALIKRIRVSKLKISPSIQKLKYQSMV